MNKVFALSLLSAASVSAATINYNFSVDNDNSIYTGNASGTSLSLVSHSSNGWVTPESGTLSTTDQYLYVWAANYGGPGSIAGFIDGVDLSTLPWERTGEISSQLTSYAQNVSFTPLQSDIQNIIANETFAPAPLATFTPNMFNGVSVAGVSGALNIERSSAFVYRLQINDSSSAVPEPSSTLALGALTLLGLTSRRRRA